MDDNIFFMYIYSPLQPSAYAFFNTCTWYYVNLLKLFYPPPPPPRKTPKQTQNEGGGGKVNQEA